MLRVVHVQKATGIGGSERHLLDLLPALAERGVDVAMLVLLGAGGEEYVDALRRRGIPTRTAPAGPHLNPRVPAALTADFRRHRPDLVHSHLIHGDLYGQIAARLANIPALSSVHSADPFYVRQPYRAAAALAGRLARRTIAISQFVGDRLVREKIVLADRLRVVYYGIRPEDWASTPQERAAARQRFGLTDDEMAVGIASRIIPGKGHDSLLRAVALARGRGHPLRVLVAGSGPLQEEMETLAGRLGLVDAATFVGFVSEVRLFMAACDVIAFPTTPALGEGFGLAALEANAAGRPVVATRVTSLPEVVADGETGLIVEPDSDEALAEGLIALAADRDLRQRLGANGVERAARLFSLDAMVDGILAVYDELVGDARPRSS